MSEFEEIKEEIEYIRTSLGFVSAELRDLMASHLMANIPTDEDLKKYKRFKNLENIIRKCI